MNYYFLRNVVVLIGIIILLSIFKILRSVFKKSDIYENVNSVLVKLVIFLSIIIYIIPFECLFLRFKSVDNIFKFFEPSYSILKKYEYDNYAYVLFSNRNVLHLCYYIKEDNNWKIENILMRGHFIKKTKIDDNVSFHIYRIPNKDSLAIIVEYYAKDSENFIELAKSKVSDSLLSEFYTIVDKKYNGVNGVSQITILNGKIDKDYTIYIGGNEYKIFD